MNSLFLDIFKKVLTVFAPEKDGLQLTNVAFAARVSMFV